ncbi:MAG TPA: PEP-CTERM sorting domain-containing protein [Terriglobales bacterium]|nr:PEP-CTERM sorting domain-containing protein [Terriglobales bacterium]
MHTVSLRARLLLAVVLLLGLPALADNLTVYTDQAAWQAVSTNLTTISFEGIAPAGGFQYFNTAAGLTTGGVQFVGTSTNSVTGAYWLVVVDSQLDTNLYDWGSGAVLRGLSGPGSAYSGYVDAFLPGGYTSLGFDLMAVNPNGTMVNEIFITLSDGSVRTIQTGATLVPTFMGLTSDTPITSVRFNSTGTGYLAMDNFRYGDDPPLAQPTSNEPIQTPEPATLGLLASGLGFMQVALRRRKS